MSSTINRNVIVNGHRTSIRLEVDEWGALEEICRSENITTNQLCAHVADNRVEKAFTSGLRVFMLNYFRQKSLSAGSGPTKLGLAIAAKAHKKRRPKVA